MSVQTVSLTLTVGSTGVHAVSSVMTPEQTNYIGFSEHFEDERRCISATPSIIIIVYIAYITITGSLDMSPFRTKVGGRFGQTPCPDTFTAPG